MSTAVETLDRREKLANSIAFEEAKIKKLQEGELAQRQEMSRGQLDTQNAQNKGLYNVESLKGELARPLTAAQSIHHTGMGNYYNALGGQTANKTAFDKTLEPLYNKLSDKNKLSMLFGMPMDKSLEGGNRVGESASSQLAREASIRKGTPAVAAPGYQPTSLGQPEPGIYSGAEPNVNNPLVQRFQVPPMPVTPTAAVPTAEISVAPVVDPGMPPDYDIQGYRGPDGTMMFSNTGTSKPGMVPVSRASYRKRNQDVAYPQYGY